MAVRIHRHQLISAIGPADIIKTSLDELDILRFGCLCERKYTFALGIHHVHSRPHLFGIAQFRESAYRNAGWAVIEAPR